MMPVPNGLGLFLLLLTLATVILVYVKNNKRSALPYPPGPRKLPILGNLLDIPTSFEWETYARWSKEYDSNIIHLKAGNDIIVLNSFSAAIELLEKRSSTFSSRPQFTMATELMGWDWLMFTMPYGEPWRESRRAFTKYFHGSDVTIYRARQTEFIHKMLPRLLDAPEDFLGIMRYAVGGMALSLAYGIPIWPSNDPFLHLVDQAAKSVAEASYVPEYIPGAGFQKKARVWRKLQEDMHEVPYQETVRIMASGISRPSFTSTSLQDLDENSDVSHQKDVIRDTAAIVFGAGADTTRSSLDTFFAAMLYFPEAQMKAQEELDRVLGGRLPEFSDEADLPYVSAVVKEIIRWKPVAPIAVPHCASEDDVYQGYHIPKGSIVIPNAWRAPYRNKAMLYDEDEYPDPSAFNPDRFMKDGQLNPDVRDPSLMAFGFGRRICPGIQVATSFLWLTVASVLAAFDISKAVDDEGKLIEPSVQYKSSLVCHPLPFKCTLKARSKAAEDLIRSAGDSY